MRVAVGIGVAAIVATVSSVILGEYELTGFTPWVAGAVVGLLVSEVALSITRSRLPVVASSVAALAAASILYAGWISSGEGVAAYPALAWPAAAVAGGVAGIRLWPRPRR